MLKYEKTSFPGVGMLVEKKEFKAKVMVDQLEMVQAYKLQTDESAVIALEIWKTMQ